MKKSFSIRSNNLEGVKLVPEILQENAKLVYRKGDVIRRTGVFNKKEIRANNDIWKLEDESWLNSGKDFVYIEHSGKLYSRAFIILKLNDKDLDKVYFDSDEEAKDCYEKIVKDFGLNLVY